MEARKELASKSMVKQGSYERQSTCEGLQECPLQMVQNLGSSVQPAGQSTPIRKSHIDRISFLDSCNEQKALCKSGKCKDPNESPG